MFIGVTIWEILLLIFRKYDIRNFIQIFLRNSISPFEPFFSTLNEILNY